MQERLLVERFLEDRDEASFVALYRQYTPRLYSFALRLLGGKPEEAEEVIQELWIRAVRGLPQFRWESELRTWLIGILIRCCSEKRRANSREPTSVDPDSPELGMSDHPELRVQLQNAIGQLTDRQREVFLLHDVEGFTHEEIASLIGIQPGTSKSQLSHARKLLRAQLKDSTRRHRDTEVKK